jgi:hypothetical protein
MKSDWKTEWLAGWLMNESTEIQTRDKTIETKQTDNQHIIYMLHDVLLS